MKARRRITLVSLLLFCLLVSAFTPISVKAEEGPPAYIKFAGSLLATDFDVTEPAGVGLWNQTNDPNDVDRPEYYAFSQLGTGMPQTALSVGFQGFASLDGINPADIEIEVHNMLLNREETFHTGQIDPANLLFFETWQGGSAVLKVQGEEIARSGNIVLKATDQITRNNQWTNEFLRFIAKGQLTPVPGSLLGQAFVDEFEEIFGSRDFQMLFLPIPGHDDLGIAASPLQDARQYVFDYTTLLTGVQNIEQLDQHRDGIFDLFDLVSSSKKNLPVIMEKLTQNYGKRYCGKWVLDAKVPVDHVKSIQIENDLHVIENYGTVPVVAFAPNHDTNLGSGSCITYVSVYDALRTSDPSTGGTRLVGAIAEPPLFISNSEAMVFLNTDALPAGSYWLRFTTRLPDGQWEIAEGVLVVHQ